MNTTADVITAPPDAAFARGWNVLGEEYRALATADQTGGAYSLFVGISPPGGGVPPHQHTREAEAFYILEGAFDIVIGEETMTVGAGAFVHLPAGVPHAYRNARADGPSRALVLTVPGGFEAFFAEMSAQPAGPPDLARVAAVAERHGVFLIPRPECFRLGMGRFA